MNANEVSISMVGFFVLVSVTCFQPLSPSSTLVSFSIEFERDRDRLRCFELFFDFFELDYFFTYFDSMEINFNS